MLLENKNAIVYGAGGAIGGAVARAFAHEGARVFLAGRSPGPVTALAGEITAKGGRAEAGHADVLDAASVEAHFAGVTARAGAVDVSFNAFGLPQRGVQGIPLAELTPDAFAAPVRDTTPEAIRAFFDARTSLGRQPTLTEVAETAASLVSDRASALTGTIVNLSCGSIVD